jgi:hypothetical protein
MLFPFFGFPGGHFISKFRLSPFFAKIIILIDSSAYYYFTAKAERNNLAIFDAFKKWM